jgi:urease accessory protein
MVADAPLVGDTFAANRATGHVALTVTCASGASRRGRIYEDGSLRLRFPNSQRRDTLEAVIVNTGGGVAGGDRFAMEIAVAPGARLMMTTAAAEKIYRSLGPDATVAVKLAVGAGATLAWLPQETILFDHARLRRSFDVDLAAGARLILAEAIVFGRTAMGEVVTEGSILDRWRVRVDGRLTFAETLRIDGAIGRKLAEGAVANGGEAVASALIVPGDDATVAAVRAMSENFAGEVGISARNGFAIARLVARDGAALRRDLIGVLTALGGGPLPRLWLN